MRHFEIETKTRESHMRHEAHEALQARNKTTYEALVGSILYTDHESQNDSKILPHIVNISRNFN